MIYLGVDCDLHRIHSWCSQCGMICKDHADPMQIFAHASYHNAGSPVTVLFEIASPMAYRDGKAAHHNLAKWMLFNMAMASWVHHVCMTSPRLELLVSPSSKWTKGYAAEARHLMAKAVGRTHDLREAESMIAFHRLDPSQWTTYKDYIHGL